jgi:hypothetical protein
MRYQAGRDDATPAEIAVRSWKKQWPHYIRVHHPDFLAGTLRNGVSLNELMKSLQSASFASTQRHALKGKGNVDPRRAYMQQPAVELTEEGAAWLNERFQLALRKHGSVPPTVLERLDWPGDA